MDRIEVNESRMMNMAASKEPVYLDLSVIMKDAENLKGLLDLETELLKKMKIAEVKKLHEEKIDILRRLELKQELMRQKRAVLNAFSEEEAAAFKALEPKMNESVKRNFHETLKAKEVNGRVVEAISMAVSDYENRAFGYDSTGLEGDGFLASKSRKTASAMALNKMI